MDDVPSCHTFEFVEGELFPVQVFNKDERPLRLFCEMLGEEGIPYVVSERLTRYLPKIQLP